MRTDRLRTLSFVVTVLAFAGFGQLSGAQPPAARASAGIPSRQEFVGHQIGADRKLVRYPRIVEDLDLLARRSDRVCMVDVGKTTLGTRMVAVVISVDSRGETAEQARRACRGALLTSAF